VAARSRRRRGRRRRSPDHPQHLVVAASGAGGGGEEVGQVDEVHLRAHEAEGPGGLLLAVEAESRSGPARAPASRPPLLRFQARAQVVHGVVHERAPPEGDAQPPAPVEGPQAAAGTPARARSSASARSAPRREEEASGRSPRRGAPPSPGYRPPGRGSSPRRARPRGPGPARRATGAGRRGPVAWAAVGARPAARPRSSRSGPEGGRVAARHRPARLPARRRPHRRSELVPGLADEEESPRPARRPPGVRARRTSGTSARAEASSVGRDGRSAARHHRVVLHRVLPETSGVP